MVPAAAPPAAAATSSSHRARTRRVCSCAAAARSKRAAARSPAANGSDHSLTRRRRPAAATHPPAPTCVKRVLLLQGKRGKLACPSLGTRRNSSPACYSSSTLLPSAQQQARPRCVCAFDFDEVGGQPAKRSCRTHPHPLATGGTTGRQLACPPPFPRTPGSQTLRVSNAGGSLQDEPPAEAAAALRACQAAPCHIAIASANDNWCVHVMGGGGWGVGGVGTERAGGAGPIYMSREGGVIMT